MPEGELDIDPDAPALQNRVVDAGNEWFPDESSH